MILFACFSQPPHLTTTTKQIQGKLDTDLFNFECRAYGLLKEKKLKTLASQAFGYLLSTQKPKSKLNRDYWSFLGEDIDLWERNREDKGQPVRAIMKQLGDGR